MPWSKNDYPDSMKNLEPSVRNKAISIANAILKSSTDMDEGAVIATAIKRAKGVKDSKESLTEKILKEALNDEVTKEFGKGL